jgi:hypothetical protein
MLKVFTFSSKRHQIKETVALAKSRSCIFESTPNKVYYLGWETGWDAKALKTDSLDVESP